MIETKTEYRKTICPLDCPDSCGLVASVKNGKVVALNGDRDHPFTRGVICRKMKGYPARVHSKDRILFPMQRTGKKGEGRFQRISWDQAFATLCERLSSTVEQFGGESILPFAYAGNMGVVNRFAGYPLFHKLGTTQLDETICSTAAKAGWRANCGDVPGTAPEVAEEAELIIIWGSNTRVTNMHFWPYVARARKKGAQLVVIDPYRNETAASADLHLKIEPGGDAALALGLLRKLMATGDLDYDFINTRTEGFDSLRDHLKNNSDDVFAAGCGVDEGQMEELAGCLRKTQRIYLRLGIGMTRNSRAAVNIRAITSLAASLGLFDGGSGRGVLLTSGAFSGDQSRLTWPSLAAKPGRRFNMVQLGNCLQTADPPIRMMFVYNANPLSTTPDGSLVRRALADDKLFTVVHEQVMTPTARYADLLLPATTFLENRDLYTSYGHFYLGFVDAVIPPLGEAKSNFTFFQELSQNLGFDDEPFQQTLDERL
ncbi:MAG TPA: molybdopterin-dependent oxidoreductase, partial [Desulfopila sp.]|nr:molybdopterin-dependent oxidoreductase [Desulfopila sp.]